MSTKPALPQPGHMVRGGHGLNEILLGPAMLYWGGLPQGWLAACAAAVFYLLGHPTTYASDVDETGSTPAAKKGKEKKTRKKNQRKKLTEKRPKSLI
jgi:hypothetical protein